MSLSDPPLDPTRRRLTELRNGLLRVHKALLESERASYERDVARITSRGQLLELLLHDSFFAWLHELSGLVVLIDETIESKEPASAQDADRLIAQTRDLLVPQEDGAGFGRRYFEALQRDPDVVLAHGEMRKRLAKLR